MRRGFDNEKYLRIQSEHIKERIGRFGNKLYLEFGGKLYDDNHASRVLPGFEPDSKLQMLMQLSDMAEIVMVLSAADIEKNKVRGDLGITYDVDVRRLIDVFRSRGLYVSSIVVTHVTGLESVRVFMLFSLSSELREAYCTLSFATAWLRILAALLPMNTILFVCSTWIATL